MSTFPSQFIAVETFDFWNGLNYQLVGFFIVLFTLTGLWIALEVIGAIFRSLERNRVDAIPIDELDDEDSSPEMYAVVAAAVHTVIRHPHEIVSISSQSKDRSKSSGTAWSSEGRKDIYRSHRVR